MKLKPTTLIFAVGLMMASCSSHNTTLPYFTDLKSTSTGVLEKMDYLPKIQVNDELVIVVSSKAPEATAQYNIPFVNPAYNDELSKTVNPRVNTYRVDGEGNISFPILGKLHVAGMNIEELEAFLKNRISETVSDPYVRVSLDKQFVTVSGEVKTPSLVPLQNRLTILEALATSGDLTEYGDRDNVLIIREVNGERTYAHLSLNSSEVLTSEYYYLQPNDYIYVAPNEIRQANSKYNQNNAFKLSVVSTIVSASSVIASLVIALTVK